MLFFKSSYVVFRNVVEMKGHRMAGKIYTRVNTSLVVLVLLLTIPFLTGCDPEKKEAQESYQAAVTALEQKNAEVDAAIADLTEAMSSEIAPLDESTMRACEESISTAQGSMVTAPEMASDTEEIKAQTAEIEKTDYSDVLEAIATAKTNLLNSIKQREQVTNPTDAFIIQRLTGVEHIQTPTAVTEEMDPNGMLNKQGGYTATVYFLSDLVDQNDVYITEFDATGNEVIDKGTEGGGAVEVYATEEEADKRNAYLAAFDGGILSGGSHNVCGTCVIRTSNKLTATQQKETEAAIIEALTRLD